AAAFPTTHALKQRTADVLKWNIDIFTDFVAVANQFQQRLVEKVRVSVEETNPDTLIECSIHLFEQTKERRSIFAIAAVCGQILGDQVDLLDAGPNKRGRLF